MRTTMCVVGAAAALVVGVHVQPTLEAGAAAPQAGPAAGQKPQGQGQGQEQEPGAGRGRGRGRGLGRGVAIGGVEGLALGRGGRGAAPIDPAGVQRQRLDLSTVIFTDAKGMTLYTFAKDAPGQSNCSGQCAVNWPPLLAAADAQPSGDWTIVTRAEGTRQWAHLGRPLYTFVKDSKPGERAGDGAGGGAWHAASPIVPYSKGKSGSTSNGELRTSNRGTD